MLKLTLVTSNDNKYREAREIIPGLERISVDLPEIQSLEHREIIGAKLMAARDRVNDLNERILIVEDASNTFEGCGRLPGTFVKFFGSELKGAEGLWKFAQAFNATHCVVRAVVGILVPSNDPVFVEGEIRGLIVAPRGTTKFFFDPIFQPSGYDKTFAEMTTDEKNAISHRGIAMRKAKNYLESHHLC